MFQTRLAMIIQRFELPSFPHYILQIESALHIFEFPIYGFNQLHIGNTWNKMLPYTTSTDFLGQHSLNDII